MALCLFLRGALAMVLEYCLNCGEWDGCPMCAGCYNCCRHAVAVASLRDRMLLVSSQLAALRPLDTLSAHPRGQE